MKHIHLLNPIFGFSITILCWCGVLTTGCFKDHLTIMEKNEDIIRKGFAGWANGTGSFFDLLADDMQWTISGSSPLSKTYTSKKQFLTEVIDPLNTRLSKRIVPVIRELYTDDHMVIVIWDGTATAKDGKPYGVSYAWFMQLEDGKIIRVTAFLDTLELTDIFNRITTL